MHHHEVRNIGLNPNWQILPLDRQKEACLHAVLFTCFWFSSDKKTERTTGCPKRHLSPTKAQQDKTRKYNTRKIKFSRHGPYNLFWFDNECLGLALEIKILSCLGHQYSILKSN